MDDKGRELRMSSGVEGNDGICNQIYELENVGQNLEYIDVFVIESYMDFDNPSKYLSSFRAKLN